MILTKNSLRDIKTALMAIPGHPGSSRISEALARSFGYADNHALKTELDAQETSVALVPEYSNFDSETFIGFLSGCDRQAALDMAITAECLAVGWSSLGDIESRPWLEGGRVILTGWPNKNWSAAATDFVERAGVILEGATWALDIQEEYWRMEPAAFTWGAVNTYSVFDASGKPRPPSEDEWDAELELKDATGISMMSFLSASFWRFRDIFNPAANWHDERYLAVDGRGLRMICGPEEHPVEVWFLMREA